MQQKNLFGWNDASTRYPATAGAKVSSGPSADAAKKIAASASRLRSLVLDELVSRGPGTADEVATRLERSALAIRPRISELRAAGLIEDTGHRRKNKSGMSAGVWRPTSAGLAAVQERGAA